MTAPAPETPRRHCFVDEAGDPTLFDARGRVLVGEAGCSGHFMLGALEVPDPVALGAELEALRASLLADPYFRDVPSMQPGRRKTAMAFHAKDDVPEVRREVFRVLLRHELKLFAVVRNKQRVLDYVRGRNRYDPAYRYHPNELYDTLVSRLFKDRLHLSAEMEVCFAARGKSDRSAALKAALETARRRFADKWQHEAKPVIAVRQSIPRHDPALQAVDYFLWAMQRHFERGESRFAELVWSRVSLLHAVDETDKAPYGRYYSKRSPLV